MESLDSFTQGDFASNTEIQQSFSVYSSSHGSVPGMPQIQEFFFVGLALLPYATFGLGKSLGQGLVRISVGCEAES